MTVTIYNLERFHLEGKTFEGDKDKFHRVYWICDKNVLLKREFPSVLHYYYFIYMVLSIQFFFSTLNCPHLIEQQLDLELLKPAV